MIFIARFKDCIFIIYEIFSCKIAINKTFLLLLNVINILIKIKESKIFFKME